MTAAHGQAGVARIRAPRRLWRFSSLGLVVVLLYLLLCLLAYLMDQVLVMRCAGLQTKVYKFAVWMWLGLIPLTILYSFIRRFRTESRRWDIFGPVMAVLVVCLVGVVEPRAYFVEFVSEHADLAPLPATASDVKTHGFSALFTGEYWFKFKASPEEIERFIADSPGVQRRQATTRKEHYREMDSSAPQWFAPRHGEPDWFRPPANARGRSFEINDGGVMVDDDHHVVYVNWMWS